MNTIVEVLTWDVVAFKEKKGTSICAVPSLWVQKVGTKNYVYWPKSNVTKLRQIAGSVPEETWDNYECIIKKTQIKTYKEALIWESVLIEANTDEEPGTKDVNLSYIPQSRNTSTTTSNSASLGLTTLNLDELNNKINRVEQKCDNIIKDNAGIKEVLDNIEKLIRSQLQHHIEPEILDCTDFAIPNQVKKKSFSMLVGFLKSFTQIMEKVDCKWTITETEKFFKTKLLKFSVQREKVALAKMEKAKGLILNKENKENKEITENTEMTETTEMNENTEMTENNNITEIIINRLFSKAHN
ncbi:unnamed protein product [Brassicogethes aeneus]|uniref:DUF4806 domain-containing protein n=1 Tax=Brassicogethes aeneus TaxID=1431903 RepID=A0A9P0BEY8_BRAAE|nr:unnamed protein product [Brassicogethes aeneus]